MSATIEQHALPAEIFDEYAGKWIALRDDHVVASADSLDELRENPNVKQNDAVYVVPEAQSVFF